MNVERNEAVHFERVVSEQEALRAVASATMVNRTHRIVRERANAIQARKKSLRELIVPLAVSAGLLAAVVFAIWTVLDEYDIAPTGTPDASQQILVFLMWCLPISAAVLAVVLFRRSGAGTGIRSGTDNEGVR